MPRMLRALFRARLTQRHDAARVVQVERQPAGDRGWAASRPRPARRRLLQRSPAAPVQCSSCGPADDAVQVELEVEADVEQARDVLGPLQVAAHPEQGVGDAAEHRSAPLPSFVGQHPGVLAAAALRAVDDQAALAAGRRASAPPGTTMIFSPHSTNGRRSTCRPSSRPSTNVGCVDSWIVGWAM